MADGSVADVCLGYLAHLNGALHPDRHAELLERIGKGKGIHDCSEHTDMVGTGPIHIAAGAPSPEVAAADNEADLDAHFIEFLDCGADRTDGVEVKAVAFIAGEHLAAELEQDSFINRLHKNTAFKNYKFSVYILLYFGAGVKRYFAN